MYSYLKYCMYIILRVQSTGSKYDICIRISYMATGVLVRHKYIEDTHAALGEHCYIATIEKRD